MSTTLRQETLEREPWSGQTRRYDILKEGVIAMLVVLVLTVVLAAVFGSADEKALTLQGWAKNAPDNFYATTVSELAGTSGAATYGPPYNTGGDAKALGPFQPQKWVGVRIPIDPANDFVITPLRTQVEPSAVTDARKKWTATDAAGQTAWATAYDTALNDPKGADGDATKVPDGDYGPVPALAGGLVALATSGALDGVLAAPGQFYNIDSTKQILFLGDGSYLDDAATAFHLQGDQWGMMNEPGKFPGQQWLAPVTVFYQLPIFNSEQTTGLAATLSGNADIYIMVLVGLLSLIVIFLPFIPGLRSIPRIVPLHRVIWREYYQRR